MKYNFLSSEDNISDLSLHNISELYSNVYYNKKTCKFYRLNEITSNYALRQHNTFTKLHYLSEVNLFFILLDILRFEVLSFIELLKKLQFSFNSEFLELFKDELTKVKHLKKIVEVGELQATDESENLTTKYYFDRKETIKHIQSASNQFSRFIDFNDFKELSFIKSQIDKNKWKPIKPKVLKQTQRNTQNKTSNNINSKLQSTMDKFTVNVTKKAKIINSVGMNHTYKDFCVGDETKQTFCFNMLQNYIDAEFLGEILEWNLKGIRIHNYLN
eukprot:GAHX01001862.1.p1 GENE.GAHX01001862.1~~GAHX01001862.1.p1  ORF type:complete len:284 (-),score=54.76 GAHX01001862.1:263-1081(-)